MGDQPEPKDVDMHESMSQDMTLENGAPTSPRKRDRSSSTPESPQSDYPSAHRLRMSGGRTDLQCDQCGLAFRKHSDLKKHNARHSRQYRCIEDGCPRSQIGFATINDLYRHEKSVHGKHVGKSRMYKCFASGCAKASKLWPRLDNFKQHLIRMHPAEDIDQLVKKSEQWHAEEEDAENSQLGSQLGVNTQESVISSLQNVKRLRSPPRPLSGLAPLMSPTDNAAARRWDLTPPTSTMTQGPRPDARPMTDPPPPRPQVNSQGNGQPAPPPATDGHRELLQRPPEALPHPPEPLSHPPPPPPPPQPLQPASEPKPATQVEPRREVGPRPEQLARVIHNTEEPGPIMQPDDTREISRAAEVRELAPEARCLSCQHYNRRCYMDQSNPWQCVACPSAQHCIFRRTVVREGPTSSFSWAELVGIQNLARKAT